MDKGRQFKQFVTIEYQESGKSPESPQNYRGARFQYVLPRKQTPRQLVHYLSRHTCMPIQIGIPWSCFNQIAMNPIGETVNEKYRRNHRSILAKQLRGLGSPNQPASRAILNMQYDHNLESQDSCQIYAFDVG